MQQSKTSIGRPQLTLLLAWGLRPSRARLCVVPVSRSQTSFLVKAVWLRETSVVRRLSKGSGNPTNGWPTREERRTLLNKNTQEDNLTNSQRDLVSCLFPRMYHLGGRVHLKNGLKIRPACESYYNGARPNFSLMAHVRGIQI